MQTDTRKIREGDLFFALRGPSFNGNDFALKALEAGAAYAIVDEISDHSQERLIPVEDVLGTLQDLAKYHREQFSIPFLAITGSNGKTTTKELVHAVLSQRFKVYTTEGNLNNHIGIPLTILRVRKDAEIAVIEMGANHQKEIAGYCRYTEPTHGIITNCGKAHLEGFGGVEGVRKGKGELYDYIRSHDGSVFAFDDYPYLHDMSKGIQNIVWYGTSKGYVVGYAKKSEPFLQVDFTAGLSPGETSTHLVGIYNLPNILCAAAVGRYFGVAETGIRQALENYQPSNSRSQLMVQGSNKIILDAYNANPTSMKAAIENFAQLPADKKILLLGAMMELGEESLSEHQELVRLIGAYPWKEVVLVGGEFGKFRHPYRYFPDATAARKWLKDQNFEEAYFLVKGSRSIAMEKVLE